MSNPKRSDDVHWVLLRNLGFLFRHALPARRKALALLEPISDDRGSDLGGVYTGLASLELARLHAHRGESEKARSRAERAIEIFERGCANEAVRQSRELIDSLVLATHLHE
jgi:hypothetical protein